MHCGHLAIDHISPIEHAVETLHLLFQNSP